MLLLLIVLLSAFWLALWIADGIRGGFSINLFEWLVRMAPGISTIAVAVACFLIVGDEASVPLLASIIVLMDSFLVIYPNSSRRRARNLAYVLAAAFVCILLLFVVHDGGLEMLVATLLLVSCAVMLAVFIFELSCKHSLSSLLERDIATWDSVIYCSKLFYAFLIACLGAVVACLGAFGGQGSDLVAGFIGVCLMVLSYFLYGKNSRGCAYFVKERLLKSEKQETEKENMIPKPAQERMDLLFVKVEDYMERMEPYLDETFTIADLCQALGTNKTLLSKTINIKSGYNFCQFLNKYRVAYAVSLMEQGSNLRVQELSDVSGFHSVVSFNMAFRLFMDDTPSEYMRTLHARNLEQER